MPAPVMKNYRPYVREQNLQRNRYDPKKTKKAGIEPKALLLLDNCTAHHFEDELCSDDGRINVIFLPPNVTPILQPMDQHIIQTIKLKYREKLHQEISFSSIDSAVHLKSINLKDVAFWLNEAWMSVSQSVLQQAWRNIGVCVGSKLLHEDDVPLSLLFQQTSRVQAVESSGLPDEDRCIDDYSDTDILAIVNNEESYETDFHDEDDDDSVEPLVEPDNIECDEARPAETVEQSQHYRAVKCLSFALEWAEENGLDMNDILHLRKIRSIGLEKCVNS
nr:tigger transposable element-derived protein 2-like [Aedes albopictus]